MIKSRFSLPGFMLLLALIAFSACKKDDTTEQELITTVQLHITGPNGFDQRFTWEDLDGDGGNDPVIDSIVLDTNRNYTCNVFILDRSASPAADITSEIQQEAVDHLLLFSVSAADLIVWPQDMDPNGDPLNLYTLWTVGGASTGTLRVRLLHEADKSAPDPGATGETDFDISFPVVIR